VFLDGFMLSVEKTAESQLMTTSAAESNDARIIEEEKGKAVTLVML
jgi:hypothetical protein